MKLQKQSYSIPLQSQIQHTTHHRTIARHSGLTLQSLEDLLVDLGTTEVETLQSDALWDMCDDALVGHARVLETYRRHHRQLYKLMHNI